MFARTVGPKGSSYRGGPPGDATAELRRVNAVRSAGRVDSAADDCEAKLDVFAMATGGLGGDDPVSIAGRRNCGRSGTDDCGSDRQSDGAEPLYFQRTRYS